MHNRNGMPLIKKGVLKKIFSILFKEYKGKLIIVLICVLASSAAGLASSVFLQKFVDNCINPGLKNGLDTVIDTIIVLGITMGSIYVVGVVSSFITSRLMVDVTQGTLRNVRDSMFEHMESLPIKYFDTRAHGDIMSLYTNDVDTLRELISQSLPSVFSTIISIVFSLSLMLYYSVWLTLIVICGVIAMFFVTKKIGGNSTKYFLKQQKAIGDVEGYIEELINGEKVVKVFCHEEKAKNDFQKLNEKLYSESSNAHKFANIMMPIMGNIGNLLYVIIVSIGSILVITKTKNISISGTEFVTTGIVVLFLNMCKQFSRSVSQLSQQANNIAMALAGASRIFDLLEQEKEFDDGYVTLVNVKKDLFGNIEEVEERTGIFAWKHPHKADGTVTYTELKGDIVLTDVDFAYVEGKNVLNDVSIYAHPGEKIALVGATGAGKTTITNLINRFYDIADGKVRYDGININKIKKGDLRRSLGIVLQDTNLFTGTVMENIRYGKLDATDEEVYEASKIANAYDFITRLPNGFNTMLTGDGANLSQGQRQLLSIARAAVANAPVMILDEATSSIDTRTELLVQRGTDKLMEGRTVFVIAHRLSTVQNSDAIMVLDHGVIIERGNHNQLIEKKGVYYQLYTGAFELE